MNRATSRFTRASTPPTDISVTGVNGTTCVLTLEQPINATDRVTLTIDNANIATFGFRRDFNDDGVVNMRDAIMVRDEYLGFGDINDDNATRPPGNLIP